MPLLTTRGAASSRGFGFQGIGLIKVEYVVVAGGGGGGLSSGGSPGGGGGAGGYRSSVIGEGSGREAYNSNLLAEPIILLSPNSVATVSIGAGGPNNTVGVNSIFSSITSAGGGRGGGSPQVGGNGGSGGGAGSNTGAAGGAGTAGQGWDGNQAGNAYGGGAGGAGSGGGNNTFPQGSGVSSYTKGGYGRTTFITGSARPLAGGGCGGAPDTLGGAGGGSNNVYDTVNPPGGYTPPSGTSIFYGGGTSGYNAAAPASGTVNTGGGGGGGSSARNENGAAGGSGIVIIRYPNYLGNLTIGAGLFYLNNSGSPIVGNGTAVAPTSTPAGYKVYTFVSGTGSITFP